MNGDVADADGLDEFDRSLIIESAVVIIRWARVVHPLCRHACPLCDALSTFGGLQ